MVKDEKCNDENLKEKVLIKLDRLRGDIPRAKFLSRLVDKLPEP
jgi:hypothetical protein